MDLPVIKEILASLSLKVADVPSPKSFGALLQLHKSSDGQYKSYVDAVFTGYGKMLGRFLYLFPTEFTTHLSEWVNGLRADALWVDNTDASFHNANAHPPLLKNTIAIPGGQQYRHDINTNTEDTNKDRNNIVLTNLSVRFDRQRRKLILLCGQEEVTIFNFGLEALPTRSPMFRLLTIFSTWQPDLTPLKVILTTITRTEKDGWIYFPRVNIGSYLILQRKAWYAPVSDLPLRQKSDSEAKYFLRVNNWRLHFKLPETVFVTISPIEIAKESEEYNNRSTDAYKPQFIDFSIPALVSHFGRELVKVESILKIEEVLPGKEEMIEVNGKERVTEFVVQWDC